MQQAGFKKYLALSIGSYNVELVNQISRGWSNYSGDGCMCRMLFPQEWKKLILWIHFRR